MLKAENISKSFGKTQAVKELNLSIEAGEIVGLLGPNGAGKTTTMQMLSGLIKPDTGEINAEKSLKAQVAVVFQETEYSSKVKVIEFLKSISVLNENREQLEKIIETVDLDDETNTFLPELSGGNKKKINIASGLLKQPDYLLLDEPTSGLDPRARKSIRNMIQDFAEERSVLVSTHSMEEAEKLCDRVIILENGREIVSGSPKELIQRFDSDFIVKAEGKLSGGMEEDARYEGDFFEIKTDKPHETVRKLVETGAIDDLENISIEKPGLEDIFFEVTGRRYEEDL